MTSQLDQNGSIRKTRKQKVVNSALWAAAGDALGWITELSRGTEGVEHRTGVPKVYKPLQWRRLVGGRGGPRVDLPAGTYSDDTQLRLAVCRSIRGDGFFDTETFAKIEMTVWPTYALGGGLGSKAAALNLSRRSVNWFSNFYDNNGQRYVDGGGNGAAMRIQPHVWCSLGTTDTMLLAVTRDALVTHGHPHGFCGALFHAMCLAETLSTGQVPSFELYDKFIDDLADFPQLVTRDPQLAAFWKPAWESSIGYSLLEGVERFVVEAKKDLCALRKLSGPREQKYRSALDTLGCNNSQYRGSGFKTALAAVYLAHIFRSEDPREAIILAANELESDTDTIATMAGAILGSTVSVAPDWEIQDRAYIVFEAERLASISLGCEEDSFSYPELGFWNPPSSQTASVAWRQERLAMAGLGLMEAENSEFRSGEFIWQWFRLEFGQSILAKRRADVKDFLSTSQLPGPRQKAKESQKRDGSPDIKSDRISSHEAGGLTRPRRAGRRNELDAWTDEIIQSDFDDVVLGRVMKNCIDQTLSIETALALAAIVAKARIARKRRRQ